MQVLPHGLPLTQFGFLVSAAGLLLRQELTNCTDHALRLRIAVRHPLLLRVELGAGWHGEPGDYGDGDPQFSHQLSPRSISTLIFPHALRLTDEGSCGLLRSGHSIVEID
jgi:hypothetical protein